jgi:type II secretory pathway component PulM
MNNKVRIQNGYGSSTRESARSWIETWLLRYRGLQVREQQLILTAAILLPFIILIFGIFLPLQDQQKILKAELAALQQQAAEAERLADHLMAVDLQYKNSGKPVNLMTMVEQLARQGKVRKFMTRIRPQPSVDNKSQSLMLQLKNVPYKTAISFVDAIAREQLGLSSIKIQGGNSSGLVHLQAVINSGY